MGKKDWKSKAKALKKQLESLLPSAVVTAKDEAKVGVKAAKPISPLAPAAFPALPHIAGVEFAAVEAGIKYQNRKDVML
ncbi:MAG: bifunctional ornithine acetyltransferase/N-acetylglutamate synthase, partial [Cypionkella sp.]